MTGLVGEPNAQKESAAMTTCPTCGCGSDLVDRIVYLGGHGYVAVVECRDRVACWTRYDLAHGLAGPETQNDRRVAVNTPAVA